MPFISLLFTIYFLFYSFRLIPRFYFPPFLIICFYCPSKPLSHGWEGPGGNWIAGKLRQDCCARRCRGGPGGAPRVPAVSPSPATAAARPVPAVSTPKPPRTQNTPKTTPKSPKCSNPAARSPAEEEPEEPCPPCPPCSHEATAPLAEGTPPVSGTPRVTPPVSGPPPEPPGDIIPLYCALLAGLVVGLVAYVAFKCWDTCRKKRQLDKARDTGDAGVAADAEKLRGDSGVCPDSAGLEPPQPLPAECPSALPGSPRRQEEPGELERLLELGAPGSDRRGPGPAGAPGDITSAV
ncbi:uncharacterized protein LOC127059323 isoform X1 [Serinus canaria]|uniref:uncharacterized protein LOC127059323 isoform X1 n=1 Tax=Serinus canaria TaxID=9135 RepID=UPI0021CC6035|nr:uncharacterized protein LOC127059323 isoform X1 [Serinus canaria]